MSKLRKCLTISVVAQIAIFLIILMFRSLRNGHRIGRCEKAGSSIDERLKDSKSALEKAVAQLQSILNLVRNR